MKGIKKVVFEASNDQFTITGNEAMSKEMVASILSAIEGLGFAPKVVSAEKKSVKSPIAIVWPEELPEYIEELLLKAQKEKKPILMDFYAAWCGPCKQMDRVVFPEENVQKETSQWVVIKIDTDRYPDLSRSFSVVGLPTFVLLANKENVLDRKEGFQPPQAFVAWLQDAREKANDPK